MLGVSGGEGQSRISDMEHHHRHCHHCDPQDPHHCDYWSLEPSQNIATHPLYIPHALRAFGVKHQRTNGKGDPWSG